MHSMEGMRATIVVTNPILQQLNSTNSELDQQTHELAVQTFDRMQSSASSPSTNPTPEIKGRVSSTYTPTQSVIQTAQERLECSIENFTRTAEASHTTSAPGVLKPRDKAKFKALMLHLRMAQDKIHEARGSARSSDIRFCLEQAQADIQALKTMNRPEFGLKQQIQALERQVREFDLQGSSPAVGAGFVQASTAPPEEGILATDLVTDGSKVVQEEISRLLEDIGSHRPENIEVLQATLAKDPTTHREYLHIQYRSPNSGKTQTLVLPEHIGEINSFSQLEQVVGQGKCPNHHNDGCIAIAQKLKGLSGGDIFKAKSRYRALYSAISKRMKTGGKTSSIHVRMDAKGIGTLHLPHSAKTRVKFCHLGILSGAHKLVGSENFDPTPGKNGELTIYSSSKKGEASLFIEGNVDGPYRKENKVRVALPYPASPSKASGINYSRTHDIARVLPRPMLEACLGSSRSELGNYLFLKRAESKNRGFGSMSGAIVADGFKAIVTLADRIQNPLLKGASKALLGMVAAVSSIFIGLFALSSEAFVRTFNVFDKKAKKFQENYQDLHASLKDGAGQITEKKAVEIIQRSVERTKQNVQNLLERVSQAFSSKNERLQQQLQRTDEAIAHSGLDPQNMPDFSAQLQSITAALKTGEGSVTQQCEKVTQLIEQKRQQITENLRNIFEVSAFTQMSPEKDQPTDEYLEQIQKRIAALTQVYARYEECFDYTLSQVYQYLGHTLSQNLCHVEKSDNARLKAQKDSLAELLTQFSQVCQEEDPSRDSIEEIVSGIEQYLEPDSRLFDAFSNEDQNTLVTSLLRAKQHLTRIKHAIPSSSEIIPQAHQRFELLNDIFETYRICAHDFNELSRLHIPNVQSPSIMQSRMIEIMHRAITLASHTSRMNQNMQDTHQQILSDIRHLKLEIQNLKEAGIRSLSGSVSEASTRSPLAKIRSKPIDREKIAQLRAGIDKLEHLTQQLLSKISPFQETCARIPERLFHDTPQLSADKADLALEEIPVDLDIPGISRESVLKLKEKISTAIQSAISTTQKTSRKTQLTKIHMQLENVMRSQRQDQLEIFATMVNHERKQPDGKGAFKLEELRTVIEENFESFVSGFQTVKEESVEKTCLALEECLSSEGMGDLTVLGWHYNERIGTVLLDVCTPQSHPQLQILKLIDRNTSGSRGISLSAHNLCPTSQETGTNEKAQSQLQAYISKSNLLKATSYERTRTKLIERIEQTRQSFAAVEEDSTTKPETILTESSESSDFTASIQTEFSTRVQQKEKDEIIEMQLEDLLGGPKELCSVEGLNTLFAVQVPEYCCIFGDEDPFASINDTLRLEDQTGKYTLERLDNACIEITRENTSGVHKKTVRFIEPKEFAQALSPEDIHFFKEMILDEDRQTALIHIPQNQTSVINEVRQELLNLSASASKFVTTVCNALRSQKQISQYITEQQFFHGITEDFNTINERITAQLLTSFAKKFTLRDEESITEYAARSQHMIETTLSQVSRAFCKICGEFESQLQVQIPTKHIEDLESFTKGFTLRELDYHQGHFTIAGSREEILALQDQLKEHFSQEIRCQVLHGENEALYRSMNSDQKAVIDDLRDTVLSSSKQMVLAAASKHIYSHTIEKMEGLSWAGFGQSTSPVEDNIALLNKFIQQHTQMLEAFDYLNKSFIQMGFEGEEGPFKLEGMKNLVYLSLQNLLQAPLTSSKLCAYVNTGKGERAESLLLSESSVESAILAQASLDAGVLLTRTKHGSLSALEEDGSRDNYVSSILRFASPQDHALTSLLSDFHFVDREGQEPSGSFRIYDQLTHVESGELESLIIQTAQGELIELSPAEDVDTKQLQKRYSKAAKLGEIPENMAQTLNSIDLHPYLEEAFSSKARDFVPCDLQMDEKGYFSHVLFRSKKHPNETIRASIPREMSNDLRKQFQVIEEKYLTYIQDNVMAHVESTIISKLDPEYKAQAQNIFMRMVSLQIQDMHKSLIPAELGKAANSLIPIRISVMRCLHNAKNTQLKSPLAYREKIQVEHALHSMQNERKALGLPAQANPKDLAIATLDEFIAKTNRSLPVKKQLESIKVLDIELDTAGNIVKILCQSANKERPKDLMLVNRLKPFRKQLQKEVLEKANRKARTSTMERKAEQSRRNGIEISLRYLLSNPVDSWLESTIDPQEPSSLEIRVHHFPEQSPGELVRDIEAAEIGKYTKNFLSYEILDDMEDHIENLTEDLSAYLNANPMVKTLLKSFTAALISHTKDMTTRERDKYIAMHLSSNSVKFIVPMMQNYHTLF